MSAMFFWQTESALYERQSENKLNKKAFFFRVTTIYKLDVYEQE
jgi:hypothetical protein